MTNAVIDAAAAKVFFVRTTDLNSSLSQGPLFTTLQQLSEYSVLLVGLTDCEK
ncbi:MAG: hypothetical protein ABJ360_09535 [Roseobacter sp.]